MRRFVRRLLTGFAMGSTALGASAQSTLAPDALTALVRQRLEKEPRACILVGVVDESTQVVPLCGARADDRKPPARDAIVEIGSITKGMTGLLLADMVRRGEVSLDDPVARHSRPGAKLPKRDGREITLRDVVTQTSGLPRLPPDFKPADMSNPYAGFDADALYEALARTELRAPIGTAYEYSNYGFMWLSEMIARAGGASYEELMKRRILQPLGMTGTSIRLDEAQRRRVAPGHEGSRTVPLWDFAPNLEGAGGLRSTMDDMLRLAEALLGRRRTALDEAITLALAPMRPAFGYNSTGFGWVTHERPGVRIHWHNGGTGGYRSIIAVNRAAGRAVVVLSDSTAGFDDLAIRLAER